MQIVEFIGVSGAGKSTIAKSLIDSGKFPNWKTVQQVIGGTIGSLGKHSEWLSDLHKLMLDNKLQWLLKQPWTTIDLFDHLAFAQGIFYWESRLREKRPSSFILADEHIVQTTSGTFIELLQINPELVKPYFERRAVILVTTNQEQIVKNALNRRATGELRAQLDKLRKEELADYAKKFQSSLIDLTRALTALGVPCFTVDNSGPLEVAVEAVGKILESLESRASTDQWGLNR